MASYKSESESSDNPILIIGGGVIGCATAYYISEISDRKIVIIDPTGIAQSSSGKAGGFLARNWHGGGVTQSLHEVGFDLLQEFCQQKLEDVNSNGNHTKTSNQVNLVKSYRQINMYNVEHKLHNDDPDHNRQLGPLPWLNPNRVSHQLGDTATAQVTPRELTEIFFLKSGAEFIQGSVIEICVNNNEQSDSELTESLSDPCHPRLSVKIQSCQQNSNIIHINNPSSIIIAAGAWSGLLCRKIKLINNTKLKPPKSVLNIGGTKSTSLYYEPHLIGKELSDVITKSQAESNTGTGVLFCDDDENGCHLEVYPRNDGIVYLCGCGGSPTFGPDEMIKQGIDENGDPNTVQPNYEKAGYAHEGFRKMVKLSQQDNITNDKLKLKFPEKPSVIQACMRPASLSTGKPIMGRIFNDNTTSNIPLYISAGHNCWGILWSAVSGKSMAELVVHGKVNCIKNMEKFRVV